MRGTKKRLINNYIILLKTSEEMARKFLQEQVILLEFYQSLQLAKRSNYIQLFSYIYIRTYVYTNHTFRNYKINIAGI